MHYLIRIELHHIQNYQPLHAAMAKRSLSRTIVSGDGTLYELPTGTYHYQANNTSAENVRVAAAAAATEIGHPNAAIVVAESSKITWTGLSVVVQKRSA